MGNDILISLSGDPTTNGFTMFVLGILFILSIYHLFLYFQNKRPIYLLYSSYTFLIFVRHAFLLETGALGLLLADLRPGYIESGLKDFTVWIYNCIYFFFIIRLVGLSYSEHWTNRVVWLSGTGLAVIAVVIQLICLIQGDRSLMSWTYIYIFLPVVTVGSLIGLVAVLRTRSIVKLFAFFGSLSLLTGSLLTSFLGLNPDLVDIATSDNYKFNSFYVGVIVENFLFSLGLGYRQRKFMDDHSANQEALISQLKENESLRESLKTRLEKEVETLYRKTEKQEIERLKAEYEHQLAELKISSLQNQMNPHFIFNSLNSIKLYIINNETANAVYYLNKFSKLIRKILAVTKEPDISLSDELEAAELYLNIENIRFNNQLQYSVKVAEGIDIHGIKVPPLILQPFIENSIWHGLSTKEGEKKMVIGVAHNGNDNITLSLEDNGVGRLRAAELKERKIYKKDSIGISLTQERMERFCADMSQEFSMEIVDLGTEERPEGTRVEMHIPIK